MAKMKSKRPNERRGDASAAELSPRAFDPRIVERTTAHVGRLLEGHDFATTEEENRFLQTFVGKRVVAPARNALDQAQDLIYDAWEATGSKRRVALAQQALATCPDCADAYVLLAEETARTAEEARDFYAQGMAAGERALGSQAFSEDVGHFRGLIETRPYMRARAGLAQALWTMGEREAAVEHFRELLRLNPNDNQGIRYMLAAGLMELGRDADLQVLLDRYKEDTSAAWAYTRALAAFRREGASRKAVRHLSRAARENPHMPLYLLGIRRMPKRLPPYMTFGGADEAQHYVVEFGRSWQQTAGALTWLANWMASELGLAPQPQGDRQPGRT